MLTSASKAYVGLAAAAFVIFMGYWIGVGGDRTGDVLLLGVVAAAALSAWAAAGGRVADLAPRVDPGAALERRAVPGPGPAAFPSTFPLVVAAGAGLLVVGAAYGAVFALLGAVAIALGLLGWFGQTWREHPSWSPQVGDKVATRVVAPFALPVSAVLVGVIVVGSVSRILLDITPHAAVAVSLLVASLIFAGCAIAATGARLSPRLLGVMTGVALLALVSAATVAGVRGTRDEEKRTLGIPQAHLTAQGTAFQQKQITVPEGRFQLTFTNDDADIFHDVALYSAANGGTPYIAFTPFAGVGRQKYPAVDLAKLGIKPGRYYFRCDFHPAMVGTFTVTAAGAGGSPG